MLGLQYGDLYKDSNAKKYVNDIAFAGTVVGMLAFGWLADHWSRTNSLLVSTIILMMFTALAAGSYYKGDAVGMFNILTAWRFFVSSTSGLASCFLNPPLRPSLTSSHLQRSALALEASTPPAASVQQSPPANSSPAPATFGSSCSPTP